MPFVRGGKGNAVLRCCPLQRCWDTEGVSGSRLDGAHLFLPPHHVTLSGYAFSPEQSLEALPDEETAAQASLPPLQLSSLPLLGDPQTVPQMWAWPPPPSCHQHHQVPREGGRAGQPTTPGQACPPTSREALRARCPLLLLWPQGWEGPRDVPAAPGKPAACPLGPPSKCHSLPPGSVHAVSRAGAFPNSPQPRRPQAAKQSHWR